jgi:uncharacterized repeat protein (TIGR03837 family)
MQKRWDIFCQVVDNFGDIGVCWRLARQLHAEHGLQVRLWVDDWAVAQQLIPALSNSTLVDGVTILHWHDAADFTEVADVAIEAFACGLPAPYLMAMQTQQSKWVNLEYLSAEAWVDDFHGKPSPQANGLVRHFYFPGFTEKTGGLIRERDIAIQRMRAAVDANLNISLFCYQNAPIHDLFTSLQANQQKVCVYVPHSVIWPKVAAYFGQKTVQAGEIFYKNNLTVQLLPFLSQADYDVLLRRCDLNFVRGEDSWIRAIWAGKPFIWQPYQQEEGAHLVKQTAFLNRFYADYHQQEMLCKAHQYWALGHASSEFWADYVAHLPALADYTRQQSLALASQPDLATQLIAFVARV